MPFSRTRIVVAAAVLLAVTTIVTGLVAGLGSRPGIRATEPEVPRTELAWLVPEDTILDVSAADPDLAVVDLLVDTTPDLVLVAAGSSRDAMDAGAAAARSLGAPAALVDLGPMSPRDTLDTLLTRARVQVVHTAGGSAAAWEALTSEPIWTEIEVRALPVTTGEPSPTSPRGDLAAGAGTSGKAGGALGFLLDPASTLSPLGRQSTELAGLETLVAPPDPRTHPETLDRLRAAPEAPLLLTSAPGLNGQIDTGEQAIQQYAALLRVAQRGAELPAGGLTVFPGRRMVALYGVPGTGVLGMLGEQGLTASIQRARDLAGEFAGLVDEPVVPAFEIIATVATRGAGPDGDYSQEADPQSLRPWVEGAGQAGLYVVLDLQPGRADLLSQARRYEELLTLPYVGLAVDPEWHLGPTERPLQRTGSVEADEVNEVSAWLAELVRRHELPQKLLTIHQFRTDMVRNRDRLDTSHPELAILLHADGQGPQGAKQATWGALRADAPEGVWWGWKNFVDEDQPMLTPAQTIAQVAPTPWFISYQ